MESIKISLSKNIVEDFERDRRNRLLSELLDQLDAKYGPVDEPLVQEYAKLLE